MNYQAIEGPDTKGRGGARGSNGGMQAWKASLDPKDKEQPNPQPTIDAANGMMNGMVPQMAQNAKDAASNGTLSVGGAQGGRGQGGQGMGGPDGWGGAPWGQRQGAASQQPPVAAPAAGGTSQQPGSSTSSPPPPAGGAQGGASPNPGGAGSTPPIGDTTSQGGGATVVGKNAGGVAQANAVGGGSNTGVVSSSAKADQVKGTGGNEDSVHNVTNASTHIEEFTYTSSSNPGKKTTITLQPGETGAFKSDHTDMGVRITPTKEGGKSGSNQVLYETGGPGAGQDAAATNVDISKVDGNQDANGNPLNMTVTLANGRMAGDGDAIRAYGYSTDDTAAMGLAGDPSKTDNIVVSNA